MKDEKNGKTITEKVIDELNRKNGQTAREIYFNIYDVPRTSLNTTLTRMYKKGIIFYEDLKNHFRIWKLNDKYRMKGFLRFYDTLFKKHLDYIMKSPLLVDEILRNEEILEKIDEVLSNGRK